MPEWVKRYQDGRRGAVCLFLRTEKLDEISAELTKKNVPYRIERTSFKVFFGLYTVKLPWRILLLPALPGTSVEISFIEYDRGVIERYSKYWKPNSRDNGITGIASASIQVPDFDATKEFLKKVFSNVRESQSELDISVDGGTIRVFAGPNENERITLYASSQNRNLVGSKFSLENVVVEVTSEVNRNS